MESSKVSLSFLRSWTCWHYICHLRSSVPCWYGSILPVSISPDVPNHPKAKDIWALVGVEGPLSTGMGRLVLRFQETALCFPRCLCWKKPCGVRAHTSARLDSWCWPCCLMELAITSGKGVDFCPVVRVDHGEEDHMAHGSPRLCLLFMPNYQ